MDIRIVSMDYVNQHVDKKDKKSVAEKVSGINNKFFKEEDTEDRHHMPYKKIHVKDKNLIIGKSDIGKRVYWSGDTFNKYYELIDIKMPDENGFSDGAYIIAKGGNKRFPISCYTDEVILHPDIFKQKRKRKRKK